MLVAHSGNVHEVISSHYISSKREKIRLKSIFEHSFIAHGRVLLFTCLKVFFSFQIEVTKVYEV